MLDITAADRIAIHETIALHGHVADDRDWDRWDELYTDDLVLDLEDFGFGTIYGIAALRKMARDNQDDPSQPLGHHVTNIVLTAHVSDRVRARSRGWRSMRTGRAGLSSTRTRSVGNHRVGVSATGGSSRAAHPCSPDRILTPNTLVRTASAHRQQRIARLLSTRKVRIADWNTLGLQ